jgi:hypothetical protein
MYPPNKNLYIKEAKIISDDYYERNNFMGKVQLQYLNYLKTRVLAT